MKSSQSASKLVLDEYTRALIERYLDSPTQAMMLTGAVGVGLSTIARTLGRQLAGANVVYLTPTLHNAQKTAIINADDIEYITRIVRDKRSERLVIIMDDIDHTAPGVFEHILKIVEEPAPNVNYLFTTHHIANIPQTILSRTQIIDICQPSVNACSSLLSGLDSVKSAQIMFLANRRPASMCRLINNSSEFENAAKQIRIAKRFITGTIDTRLALVAPYKDRSDAMQFVNMLAKLTEYIHQSGKVERDAKLADNLQLISTTASSIQANGNVKAQLLNLAMCYN